MILDIEHGGLFLCLLPIVSFLYASVGHGGASGYLALMALFSFSSEIMKPTALCLNILVSSIAFYHYYDAGHFNKKLFWSFAVTSIPMSFLGGFIDLNEAFYRKALAIALLFALLKMLGVFGKETTLPQKIKIQQAAPIGAAIGLFSGFVGIGGGIMLSPVILLMRWGKMKETAGVSALFILVNSSAGMLGHLSGTNLLSFHFFLMALVAFAGGVLGAYVGSKKFSNIQVRGALLTILFFASVKLWLL